MSYGYETSTAASVGGLAKAAVPARPESRLESITSRVHRMADGMEEIAAKLRVHADSVFGSVPEADNCNKADVRCGQLGSLDDALDRLERVHSAVAEQAGRNCTLA